MCDLDGVVYRGDQPIPGAVEALEEMRRSGISICFCTNNSAATVSQNVTKLTGLGLTVTADRVLTSAVVTGEELERRGCAGKSAIVVGGDGIVEALTGVGITIVEDPGADEADLVVVGLETGFDYAAMKRAANAARAGADLIATNDDVTFPAPDGLWPGAGAILASIEAASGRTAEVMGKPHDPMMDAAARRLEGAEPIAVVGDRPETDLAGGRARGWTTILVLTGVTDESAAQEIEPPPDAILESLADLPAAIDPDQM